MKLQLEWVEAASLEPESKEIDAALYDASWRKVTEADGILVPGGFGSRGVEGKILAANYARLNKKPYLGICLGMQVRALLGYPFAYVSSPLVCFTHTRLPRSM